MHFTLEICDKIHRCLITQSFTLYLWLLWKTVPINLALVNIQSSLLTFPNVPSDTQDVFEIQTKKIHTVLCLQNSLSIVWLSLKHNNLRVATNKYSTQTSQLNIRVETHFLKPTPTRNKLAPKWFSPLMQILPWYFTIDFSNSLISPIKLYFPWRVEKSPYLYEIFWNKSQQFLEGKKI